MLSAEQEGNIMNRRNFIKRSFGFLAGLMIMPVMIRSRLDQNQAVTVTVPNGEQYIINGMQIGQGIPIFVSQEQKDFISNWSVKGIQAKWSY